MNFSYSMINTFLQCPQKFEEVYINKHREEKECFEVGSICHSVCENFINNSLKKDNLYEFIFNKCSQSKFNEWDLFSQVQEIMSYKTLDKLEKAFKDKNVTTEKRYTIENFIDNYNFVGVIDVSVDTEDTITILDFKTSGKFNGDYQPDWNQLFIYAYMYCQQHNIDIKQKKIQLCLWYLRDNTIKNNVVKYDNILLYVMSLKKTCRDIINAMSEKTYPASKNNFCKVCFIKEKCKL